MSDYSFKKQLRLLNSEQYQFVFENTKLKVGSSYILLLASRNTLTYSRLGLIVPKKKVKRATDRNRMKRLLRENFRLNHHQITGLDIIALVRSDITKLDKSKQTEHIQDLYAQLIKKQAVLSNEGK